MLKTVTNTVIAYNKSLGKSKNGSVKKMSIKEFKNRFKVDKNILEQLRPEKEMCITVNTKNNNSLVYKVNFLNNVVTYVCQL